LRLFSLIGIRIVNSSKSLAKFHGPFGRTLKLWLTLVGIASFIGNSCSTTAADEYGSKIYCLVELSEVGFCGDCFPFSKEIILVLLSFLFFFFLDYCPMLH